MATSSSQEAICTLVEDSILQLETEAGRKPNYDSVVVTEDTLLVMDEIACNLQLYSRHDGKLYTSKPLESRPIALCLISKTDVAVCLSDSKILILSFKLVDDVKRVKTLDVMTRIGLCHSVAKWNSDKLVVSGRSKDDMLCWCVVNLTDERVDSTHNICKGVFGWSYTHLAINYNTVYVSCQTDDSTTEGVYAYDISNPHRLKFLYQHHGWKPGPVMADKRNFIFVIGKDSNWMHQLTDSGQLVTMHTVSSDFYRIFYDDQHGVLYTTREESNVITVFRLEYSHQPGIPIEILNMDDRSIQLFEEALKDGTETVYSIRIMVVGHIGVGKTTLVKRLLGEEVNISDRCSTEGIDVYVNCCDVSLSTHEWTRRTKDSEQDYRLQRLARVLNEKQSIKDKATHEEQVIIPPQGEITHKNQKVAHIAFEDEESDVLYNSPQQDRGQDILSTASQQEESHPALGHREPIQSETSTMAMLKLLQENVYNLKQDTGKTFPLTVWDFAGQYAFYTTHQTFLTRQAIYLLVTDVSEQLSDFVADEFYFDSQGMMKCKVHELTEVWLNSIHSCAPFPEAGMPPVILVGTHVDKLSQKQSSAKGTAPETQTKKLATVKFTATSVATQDTTSTKEQPRASTILRTMKKVFKLQKTKGIVGATPVSSTAGASTLPIVDQPKRKRRWGFWPRRKKGRVHADTEKRCVADNRPNIASEIVMNTAEYSTPARVEDDNSQEILIALYSFMGNDPEDLSFFEGDKLICIEKSGSGWWLARNSQGEVGQVPANFMHVQTGLADNLPNFAQEVVVHTDELSTAVVDIDNSQKILIALYSFIGNGTDKLSFSEGDKLIFVAKSCHGWLQARNSQGEVGLVPSNYVNLQGYSYKMCERYFREIRSYLRDKPTRFHLVDEDFAINNTVVDPRLAALKRKIVEVASQQPYWGEVRPARWIPLEQELMKLRSAEIKVIPWNLLEDLNKALAVPLATEELDLFLRFQHDIGTVLYFSMEILKRKIVLDPKWMIDALKSLITAEMFVLRSTPAVTEKWYEFKEKGKLSMELVDALWTKEKCPDLHDNKEHILKLMEQLNIIAKLRVFSDEASEIKEEDYFLAPCMLRQKTPREVICPLANPQMESSSVLCYVFVGKYLPSPIFHRLLAACVAHWPIATKMNNGTLDNLIFCGCCVFQLDHYHKLTIHFRDYIIFMRVTRKGISDKTPSTKLCIEVRQFVTATLINIIGCLGQSLKFEYFIQCPEYNGDSVNSLIPVSLLKQNAEVCCVCHDNIMVSAKLLKFWFEDMGSQEGNEGITANTDIQDQILPQVHDVRLKKMNIASKLYQSKVKCVKFKSDGGYCDRPSKEEKTITVIIGSLAVYGVPCSDPKVLCQILNKSQQDASSSLSRLEVNCLSVGLELYDETPANGNCFFEAVSSQLQRLNCGVQRSPQQLRQEVVAFMRTNRVLHTSEGTITLDGFIYNETYDNYCTRMARNGEWADHVVVVAMARKLQMDIFIVTSSPSAGPDDIIVWVVGQTGFQGMPILLGHIWESHYLSLQPIAPAVLVPDLAGHSTPPQTYVPTPAQTADVMQVPASGSTSSTAVGLIQTPTTSATPSTANGSTSASCKTSDGLQISISSFGKIDVMQTPISESTIADTMQITESFSTTADVMPVPTSPSTLSTIYGLMQAPTSGSTPSLTSITAEVMQTAASSSIRNDVMLASSSGSTTAFMQAPLSVATTTNVLFATTSASIPSTTTGSIPCPSPTSKTAIVMQEPTSGSIRTDVIQAPASGSKPSTTIVPTPYPTSTSTTANVMQAPSSISTAADILQDAASGSKHSTTADLVPVPSSCNTTGGLLQPLTSSSIPSTTADVMQAPTFNSTIVDVMQPRSVDDTDRFMHIACLLVNVGSRVLRRLLLYHTVTPACTLDQYLAMERKDIDDLTKSKILNKSQMDILFPQGGCTNLGDYDITLLSALFTNIVITISQQQLNMIQFLRDKRNQIFAHARSVTVNSNDYQTFWNDICRTLETLSKQCGDPDFENEILREIEGIQLSTVQGTSFLDTLQTHPRRMETLERLVQDLISSRAQESNKESEDSDT